MCCVQYLQHIFPAAGSLLEKFALLVCIGIIWSFAAILTVAGAYNNVREPTKLSCRIDRSFLMSSAPWYVIQTGYANWEHPFVPFVIYVYFIK